VAQNEDSEANRGDEAKGSEAVQQRVILDEAAIGRALTRIAYEIVERNRGIADCVLVGVLTRGVHLAQRVADRIERIEGEPVPIFSLDITLYRDDGKAGSAGLAPSDGANLAQLRKEVSRLLEVEGKTVIVFDDVLYTGRTIRAAMEAIMDGGRPRAIELAVLVDRGHRELPIRPDYIGKNVPTSSTEEIVLHLREVDGEDVLLLQKKRQV
jgi:pyrimidine operon attenuation protein/uracil phosphoribosyltransferase